MYAVPCYGTLEIVCIIIIIIFLNLGRSSRGDYFILFLFYL